MAFLALTFFIFSPATVYLTNVVEFTNSFSQLFLVGIGLALAAALVFWLILQGLRLIGPRVLEKGLALLFAFAFLLWAQGNVLLWKYGPLDGREIHWSALKQNGYIDGSLWVGMLALAFIFSPFIMRSAKRICQVMILMQLAYGAFLLFNQQEKPSFQQYTVDTAKKFAFSKNKNVIFVVLDSFQTDVFNEIILENPGIADALDGFTYFRNALGGFPATELSVVLMLTGMYYDNSLPFEQWKREAYLSHSLPHVLKSAGWQVDVFPKVSYSMYYADSVASNFVKGVSLPEQVLDILQIYDLALFRSLPHFVKPCVYNDQAWLLRGIGKRILGRRVRKFKIHTTRVMNAGAGKKRPKRYFFSRKTLLRHADVQFVNQMLSESATADTQGTFKFYHLGLPHIPLTLDENLQYIKMPVNRTNYKKYATAAVKLMIIFLERLQKLGIYDDARVVILGDHGAGGQEQRFILQPGMPTEEGKNIVTERSRISSMPLLLFKPGSSRGPLKISDAPVTLGDLPATVFFDLGMEAQAPGMPMQSLADTAQRERRFLIYAGRDIFSYYGDMTEYLVSGYGWLEQSWRRSGKGFTRKGMVTLPH